MAGTSYKSIYIEFEGRNKLGNVLKQIDSEATSLNANLREINKNLKLDPGNTDVISQKFVYLKREIDNVTERLNILREAKQQADRQLANTQAGTDQYKELETQIKSLDAEIERSERRLRNFQLEARNTAEALGSKLKEAVNDLKQEFTGAIDVIKKAEAALIALSAASVKTGSTFEQSMSEVAAVMAIDKTTEEYQRLEEAARESGKVTVYTASESALALRNLALAGYNADEAIERLPKVLALAKAGALDLYTASKIVTNSMASLQLTEEELDKLLDEMARTSQRSNTNIAELGEAIKIVGGTMNMAGQPIETMFTQLGILANAGMTAGEAGTRLRNIMLSLAAPTDKAREAIDELGISITDDMGNIRDLGDILIDIREATKDMNNGELVETFDTIFKLRDLTAINALLNGTTGEMQALREEIVNSQGAAQQMADTMTDNLIGDFTILKSAIQELQIAINEHFTPVLRDATKYAQGLVGELTESAKNGELAESFDRFGKALAELMKNGASLAVDVLPTLIDGLTLIAEHLDDIIAIWAAMKTATAIKNLVTGIETIIASVMALKTAIVEANMAQEVFNATAAANPLVAIATAAGVAVGALVGIITKASLSLEELDDNTIKISESVKQLSEETDSVITSTRELQDSIHKTVNELEEEKTHYQSITDSLYELANAENLSAGQKEKMKAYVDELNSAYPTLNLHIDETTGKLDKEKESVETLISSYKDLEKLKVLISSVSALEVEQDKLQEQYDKLKEQREQAKQDLLAAKMANANLIMPGTEYDKEAYDAILKPLEENLNEINREFNRTSSSLRSVSDEISYYNEEIEKISSDPVVQSSSAFDTLSESISKTANSLNKEGQAIDDNTKKTKKLEDEIKNYRSELTGLLGVLDNVNKGTAYSTSQILELISKYPELSSAIQATSDGYYVESAALENLIRVKAQSLIMTAREEIVRLQFAQIAAGISKDYGKASELESQMNKARAELEGYMRIANDIENKRIYSTSSSKSSSSSSSGSSSSEREDKTDYYKQQAEQEIAALEHEYKMGRMLAEEYYNKLDELNKKWYLNKYEYLDDYRKYEEKIYAGLEKIQEDRVKAAKDLESSLVAVKKAQDDLNNANNQQVNVYSAAAGYHAELNSAAITKAQQTLFEKQQSLSEILSRTATLGGLNMAAISANMLPNLRALLPDLSGLRLPSTSGGTTNNEKNVQISYSPEITIQGNATAEDVQRLKDTLEQQFNKLINDYITKEYNTTLTGGV